MEKGMSVFGRAEGTPRDGLHVEDASECRVEDDILDICSCVTNMGSFRVEDGEAPSNVKALRVGDAVIRCEGDNMRIGDVCCVDDNIE
jgi:hypothetical protein